MPWNAGGMFIFVSSVTVFISVLFSADYKAGSNYISGEWCLSRGWVFPANKQGIHFVSSHNLIG